MPAGMDLTQFGVYAADPANNVDSGRVAVKTAIELHGYLQAALMDAGLDKALMPQSKGQWIRGLEAPS